MQVADDTRVIVKNDNFTNSLTVENFPLGIGSVVDMIVFIMACKSLDTLKIKIILTSQTSSSLCL